jgi:hypothetical protein
MTEMTGRGSAVREPDFERDGIDLMREGVDLERVGAVTETHGARICVSEPRLVREGIAAFNVDPRL